MKRTYLFPLCLLLGIPALFTARRLYFLSVQSVNVRMAVYKTGYDLTQADKAGMQELNHLVATFPNVQTFRVTWDIQGDNFFQEYGIAWNRPRQTYTFVCLGATCPMSDPWHGISQTDIEKAASNNQTMWDVLKQKHLTP